MLDSSPAVRDAALELVGKYVVSRPDLAAEYLPKICARTNVSIRFHFPCSRQMLTVG